MEGRLKKGSHRAQAQAGIRWMMQVTSRYYGALMVRRQYDIGETEAESSTGKEIDHLPKG